MLTITPATAEPVTLEQAKADLRMTHDADDGLISRQITSARETVEQWTGLALGDATYTELLQSGETLQLIPATVQSLTRDGEAVAFTNDGFGRLCFAGGPAVVTFQGAPQYIPEPLKTAMLLLVRREYEVSIEQQQVAYSAALAMAWPYRRNLGA
ncbi:head-tail connector protein [Pseudoxanthomonas winnipegensis]|uniref:Phage gp6-like head-tail connector protein n=1 Tax=Pseudoxanthomonas winnipegensis TaxID=2480810 RepID=A0A4Q8L593_9GAMM|nr:phage head-tail connector protein [Pseudoxanthomonas winnipegensis]TAA20297.1 hypothetical protein EA660_18070 [Pseudoxanthomonas winnipegensis]